MHFSTLQVVLLTECKMTTFGVLEHRTISMLYTICPCFQPTFLHCGENKHNVTCTCQVNQTMLSLSLFLSLSVFLSLYFLSLYISLSLSVSLPWPLQNSIRKRWSPLCKNVTSEPAWIDFSPSTVFAGPEVLNSSAWSQQTTLGDLRTQLISPHQFSKYNHYEHEEPLWPVIWLLMALLTRLRPQGTLITLVVFNTNAMQAFQTWCTNGTLKLVFQNLDEISARAVTYGP